MKGKKRIIFRGVMLVSVILLVLSTMACPKKQTTPLPPEEKKEGVQPPPKAAEEPQKEPVPTQPSTVQPPPPSPAPSPPPSAPSPPPPSLPPSPKTPSPLDQRLMAISNGEILLNPKVKEDAKLIQNRLADLGLYKGPIDGIWGKGSESALKTFKTENALPHPLRWDRETQMLLFREMPSDPEVMKRAIARGEIILNPLIPQDAKLIQGRLAELGFYQGAIDGIWGKGSESALKAFKEKNGLGNPTQWDKETQLNLFR